jgi:hypothetical protein
MPNTSLTHNTRPLRRYFSLYKWPYWFIFAILGLGFSSLIVFVACPNPIGAAIAASLLLSLIVVFLCNLCAFCGVLCILKINEVIEASNTPNQDADRLPTYEEIIQEDEKQLPSYDEACRIEREQLANLRMSAPQPMTTERTCLISTTPPPPYGTFLEKSESCKQTSSHIEATIDSSHQNTSSAATTSTTNTWPAEEVRPTYSPV